MRGIFVFGVEILEHSLLNFLLKYFCLQISETSISNFLEAYMKNFSEETVFPKLHMLEWLTVDKVKLHKRGLGFFGEQGVYQIHHCTHLIRHTQLFQYAWWSCEENRTTCEGSQYSHKSGSWKLEINVRGPYKR